MVGPAFVCPFSSHRSAEPAVGESPLRPPRGCRRERGGLQLMAVERHPGTVPGRSCVSLGPAPGLVLHGSARLQGTLDERVAPRRARTPRRAHQNAAFCVCVYLFFFFFLPSLLALSELEQYRQLQACQSYICSLKPPANKNTVGLFNQHLQYTHFAASLPLGCPGSEIWMLVAKG